MRRIVSAFTLAFAVAAAGCDRSPNKSADTTLNTDLSLAAQQRGFQPLDSLSAAERAATGAPVAGAAAPRTLRRTTSGGDVARTRRSGSTSGSSRASTSSGTTQSSGTVVKHTKRDAAIGAAAGAIIGATTSRDKVKGGVIGGAAGAILGGIIGTNVDKKKTTVP